MAGQLHEGVTGQSWQAGNDPLESQGLTRRPRLGIMVRLAGKPASGMALKMARRSAAGATKRGRGGPRGDASLLPTPGEALQCPLLTRLSSAAACKGARVSGSQGLRAQ